MQTKTSLKLQKWNKKDIVNNVLVYVFNVIAIVLLFLGAVALSEKETGTGLSHLFVRFQDLINFILLVILIAVSMFIYFFFEDRDFLKNASNSEMMFLLLEVGVIICFFTGKLASPYIRPLALVAIMAVYLTDGKTAILMNLFFNCLLAFFDSFSGLAVLTFEHMTTVYMLGMGISSGIIGVYCIKEVFSRLKLLALSFIISFPALLCVVIPIANNGLSGLVASIVATVFSGPVAAACLIIFLPIFEVLFKKVSCFRFNELTDHKNQLIKKLITHAPGTFNHSMVVSNIAEACATAIGEDAVLARTCAYYHDIGKIRRPEFFGENQVGGKNLHEDLTPELSANIIKAHTQDGYMLLKKKRLPDIIADVCLQHHGTMPIWYFYDKAKKFTDGEVSLSNFSYQGKKPQTKIAAIIMIADGCEAAVRTLKDRSRDKVTEVVKKIVNERMQLGQFDECEITIKELNIIIHTVVNSLSGVYHSRIQYPKVSLDGLDVN